MLENIDIIKRWFAFDITNMRFFEKSISKLESSDEIRKTRHLSREKNSRTITRTDFISLTKCSICVKNEPPRWYWSHSGTFYRQTMAIIGLCRFRSEQPCLYTDSWPQDRLPPTQEEDSQKQHRVWWTPGAASLSEVRELG